MRVRLGFIGKLVVEKVGRSGGLCLFWSSNVNVVLKGYARSHIDVMVCSHGDLWWRYTGFYGQPETHLRSQFWCLLERLADGYSGPWFGGGDFNEIHFSYEKSGGSVRAQSLMDGFRNALAKCGLVDMGYEGAHFTWCNKHTNRMVCSSGWHSLFSNSYVSHLKLWGLDHRPLLTRILRACESRKRPKQKCRFHFEMAWANDSGCWEIIAKHWGPSELTNIGGALNDWNGMRTHEGIRKKKKELEVMDSNLNDSNWLSYKKMENELDVLLYKDEKYWFSRAKNSWLKFVWVESPRGIAVVFEEYFSSLFTSHDPPDEVLSMGLDSIQPRGEPSALDPVTSSAQPDLDPPSDTATPFVSTGPPSQGESGTAQEPTDHIQ
ncbi:hypothetical protein G4B88_021498 [Cannabis sativa]|uniref:Uncharacterized protein n=1 Tax=Cannabis sativa TaxID=3483 RepID=A0A7J6H063_CANSA|nr:hypothetical protein G4B88_021498 [Cannabis sativa]